MMPNNMSNIPAFLLNNLPRSCQTKFLRKFGSLKTNALRVNYVYKHLLEHCPDYPPFIKDEKNDVKAIEIRETGNTFFRSGQYREALHHYTASILTAKSNDVLSLAYANRSAALSKLNRYKECLMDIERALQHGYPDELKPKLIARQKLAKAQKDVDEKAFEPVPKIQQSKKNPLIECAADNVKIATTQQYGRGVIATRDIQIGDIIAIEKPYAAIVTHENEKADHCNECMELCYNLIPCNTCTKALYCSVKCREQAFSYHQYECSIKLSLDSIFVDVTLKLALKMLFLAKNELERSDSYEVKENEIFGSDRFKEVYNMEVHINKRDNLNLYSKAAEAAGVFHLIKNHTAFLQDGVDEDYLKGFLLLLILISDLNAVNINELTPELMSFNFEPKSFSLGIGVYSFFTLVNHSCWPNVMRQFHGDTMVMRAINTIKKGEQCFVSHGANYLDIGKEIRQDFLLNQKFFKCTCRACEENWANWPMRHVLDMQRPFDEWLALMQLSSDEVNFAKVELPKLLSKANILERKLPPGRDHDIKEILMFCYDIFGNKRKI